MIRQELRPDGVAVLTWDLKGQQANVLSAESITRFAELCRAAIADPQVAGVVVASAKRDFLAGADLTRVLPRRGEEAGLEDRIMRFHGYWRDIEKAGKPFVAALNGSTLGGGFELALACHRRIAADNPAMRVGLPEVTLALIPGGGGTQRLPRLIGIEAALPMILGGTTVDVAEAARLGMVDELVAADELLDRAVARVLEAGPAGAVQPWDRPGWTEPSAPAGMFDAARDALRRRTRGLQTAPERALAAVEEGCGLPIDAAIRIETRHFVASCLDPQAANTIRTNFFGIASARKLATRPSGIPVLEFRSVGVLGAGMMGQGIAQVAAAAGLDVTLLDATAEQAATGLERISANLGKQVARGFVGAAKAAEIAARITPTADHGDLARSDIVIEAVFEDRDIKADVTRRAEAATRADCIFASNTSTLPITGLATASSRPGNFIGMHFFSPVDRMALVEVIMGEKTSDLALAHSLDFIRTLRKTPIVVRDGRGFYTSRVFATYIYEALEMLEEGVAPEIVEAGGLLTGLPLSPLALSDQLSIGLAWKVQKQERIDLGNDFRETAAYRVCRMMVETLGRAGRAAGAGYYDYPASGEKVLWPGLAARFRPLARQPEPAEVAERFLAMQSLETMHCLDEGILLRPIDGDIGAVLGWGYPAWRGGPVAHVDTIGPAAFLARCDALRERHGERYAAPANLRGLAMSGQHIYDEDPSKF